MYSSFEGWRQAAINQCELSTTQWKAIGDWMYPTKENISFREVFVHLCVERKTRERSIDYSFNECKCCGEKVPDGIKMIALLEKL